MKLQEYLPIVEVEGLTKQYKEATAVDDISFTVYEGEIFGILGPNGAGKTTTLEILETLRLADSGRSSIAGIDIARQPQEIRKIIGVQTQESKFFERATLREILKLMIRIYDIPKVRPEELLERVQLSEKASSWPEKLSGGQLQRFSVAAALANSPRVLFLDEPTTGLDPQARRNMWELIEELNAGGITIVLTTHYMDEAERLCDRLAIMDEGRIVSLDSPEAMIQQLLNEGFHKEQMVQQANLEDVFLHITGKELRE